MKMNGYCMSKSALNMQSVLLHNHIYDKGGQVIVIHPGWMKTTIKGSLEKNADYHPDESAGKIYGIVTDHKRYHSSKPAFIDLNEKTQLW